MIAPVARVQSESEVVGGSDPTRNDARAGLGRFKRALSDAAGRRKDDLQPVDAGEIPNRDIKRAEDRPVHHDSVHPEQEGGSGVEQDVGTGRGVEGEVEDLNDRDQERQVDVADGPVRDAGGADGQASSIAADGAKTSTAQDVEKDEQTDTQSQAASPSTEVILLANLSGGQGVGVDQGAGGSDHQAREVSGSAGAVSPQVPGAATIEGSAGGQAANPQGKTGQANGDQSLQTVQGDAVVGDGPERGGGGGQTGTESSGERGFGQEDGGFGVTKTRSVDAQLLAKLDKDAPGHGGTVVGQGSQVSAVEGQGSQAGPQVHSVSVGVGGAGDVSGAQVGAEGDGPDTDPNVARVARGLRGIINQKGGSVTIRLDPPELGAVRVQMHMVRGTVSVDFHAGHESVRTLLSHQLGQLRHLLETQGLAVDRLHVQSAPQGTFDMGGEQHAEQAPDDGQSKGQYAARPDDTETDDGSDEAGGAGFDRVLNAVA